MFKLFTLLKMAQMMANIPEISELDINPLFAGKQGVGGQLYLDSERPTQRGCDRL